MSMVIMFKLPSLTFTQEILGGMLLLLLLLLPLSGGHVVLIRPLRLVAGVGAAVGAFTGRPSPAVVTTKEGGMFVGPILETSKKSQA